MKGFENNTTLVAYIISNVVAVFILLIARKQPRLGRLIFLFVFIIGSIVNWNTALNNPDYYLSYAGFTFMDAYRQFIFGWFSRHIKVTVGFIAICQALIGVSMLMKGWILKAGTIGAIVFLLAIAPLGIGSAFPFSIITSIALYLIFMGSATNYLWVNSPPIKYAL